MTSGTLKGGLLAAVAVAALTAAPSFAQDIGACLITKTDTNPFFVKMKEGAAAKAEELGITLKSYAGKVDGDTESQVQAVETCIADGAKGILIAASDTSGIVPTVKKARDAGLLVIALDTPLSPIDAADATFATDNFKAGELIGKWAAASMGDGAADATDRLPRPQPVAADGRRAPRPGLHGRLRHRRQGRERHRRRGRSPHRRPRRDQRQRGGRAHRDGEPPPEGPDDQRRPHDQRARRRRRLRGAQGRGPREATCSSSRSTAAAPA